MPFNIITTFNFSLLLVATLIFANSHAREIIPNPKSLVLGLTYSRSTIPTPKSATKPFKKPSQMLDMTEQLKEVRDGYIISLNLGTPPQIIQVYLDTGGDLTWVPCGNLSFDCLDCDDYRNNKLTASFSPSRSSSSSRDSCSTSFCKDIHSSDNSFDTCTMSGCSLSTLLRSTCCRPCPSFAYTYGDGIVAGTLTRDILRVHASNPNSTQEIVGFCFGCVSATYREPIRIAGFGKGPLSLPSQLGFLQKGFSHCFLPFKYANNPNFSSPLIVGELAITSKDYLQFTPMLKSPMYPNFYYIGLQSISVGNITTTQPTQVPLSLREFDSSGNGGMIIDSGTTYTHLPEPLYTQLLGVLEGTIRYPRATQIEERSGFDLCYSVPCQSNNILGDDDLPTITFHFLNNVSLTLPQGNSFYAMGAPNNSTVVKCLLIQSMDESYHYGPAGVFGSFQQQNVEVVYDLEKERVGFKVADCATMAAVISPN